MFKSMCRATTAALAVAAVAFASASAHAQRVEARARQSAAAAPDPIDVASIEKAVQAAHRKYQDLQEGANADYIPALAEVPSELFGISVVTVDGTSVDVGDSTSLFSIQSISKAFVLALVMQEAGDEAIMERIGVDATGRPFNSIQAIEDMPERTVNSLVNAGAIATTSLMPGSSPEEQWRNVVDGLSRFAGRPLEVNGPVCESELATNERNQAIARLLDAYGRIYCDPPAAVDTYTRQCALNVSSHDLAVMGATLANGGRNPVTGVQVLDTELVPRVLAVMATAGLYEDTGVWMYTVGLPAKSGVGGGIVAVAPGRFGIAAFSPRLDAAGNSVRAQRAIRDIAAALDCNVFFSAARED